MLLCVLICLSPDGVGLISDGEGEDVGCIA